MASFKSGDVFDNSSSGMFCKIFNSEPNSLISFSYSVVTDLLDGPTPLISEIISCNGTREKTFPAVFGKVVIFFLSESSFTRDKTPMVKGLPHIGHIPLYFFASSRTCYTYIIRLQAYNSIDILYKKIRL